MSGAVLDPVRGRALVSDKMSEESSPNSKATASSKARHTAAPPKGGIDPQLAARLAKRREVEGGASSSGRSRSLTPSKDKTHEKKNGVLDPQLAARLARQAEKASAASQIGDNPAIANIAMNLHSPDSSKRLQACLELRQAGIAAAPYLGALGNVESNDASAEVREAAANAMEHIQDLALHSAAAAAVAPRSPRSKSPASRNTQKPANPWGVPRRGTVHAARGEGAPYVARAAGAEHWRQGLPMTNSPGGTPRGTPRASPCVTPRRGLSPHRHGESN